MPEGILTKIADWSKQQEPIRALILEGSQAEEGKADALSDYDVNIFITDPTPYAQDDGWIHAIDQVWVYIPEKTTHSGQVLILS